MTDSPGNSPSAEAAEGAGRRRGRLRWVALGAVVLVAASSGAGWSLVRKLDGNITTDTGTAAELRVHERERPPVRQHEARTVLLIGSDNRGGGNGRYGRDTGTQRSDTTILLRVAADSRGVTAVSIPRDLMVQVPDCTRPDGTTAHPVFAQFNSAFQTGGAACTIRTVEQMTDIRIDHHMIVDFAGFTRLVNAVHGVEMCLPEPVNDPKAHLRLPAGRQVLDGEEALGYVRARYTLGNGSDTERMERQQEFLAALVKKVQSNGVLLNPARLYPLLDAATSSLTTDAGLDSLDELYDLATAVRDVPPERVSFLTVPRRPYAFNPNRDELIQPAADHLFAALRNDEPIRVATDDKDPEKARDQRTPVRTKAPDGPSASATPSITPDASPSASPTYRGIAADNNTCA